MWKSRLAGLAATAVPFPWVLQLLEEIQKVNFSLLGHHVYFNQQGDLPVDLEVAQWLWEPSGTPFRSVAFYDHLKRKLNVTHEVTWHTPNNEVGLRVGAGVRAWHRGSCWVSKAPSIEAGKVLKRIQTPAALLRGLSKQEGRYIVGYLGESNLWQQDRQRGKKVCWS